MQKYIEDSSVQVFNKKALTQKAGKALAPFSQELYKSITELKTEVLYAQKAQINSIYTHVADFYLGYTEVQRFSIP